ncbi:MAG: hypothetical protein N2C14_13860, partial [Planctomycetales bacterium]
MTKIHIEYFQRRDNIMIQLSDPQRVPPNRPKSCGLRHLVVVCEADAAAMRTALIIHGQNIRNGSESKLTLLSGKASTRKDGKNVPDVGGLGLQQGYAWLREVASAVSPNRAWVSFIGQGGTGTFAHMNASDFYDAVRPRDHLRSGVIN